MKNGRKIIAVTTAFLIILSVMLYLTFMANSSATEASASPITQKTIIVDAGHGGEDGGAIGLDGTVEKDINLDIALKLEKLFEILRL